jgi:hypothetical protein
MWRNSFGLTEPLALTLPKNRQKHAAANERDMSLRWSSD